MNIVVNGRFLSRNITGVERYATEILCTLPGAAFVLRPPQEANGFRGHLWEQLVLPSLIKPGDLLWSPANSGPFLVTRQVLTLHDLSPLEHASWFSRSFAIWYKYLLPRLLPGVNCVIVSSNHIRRKLLARFHIPAERVSVVPGGVDLGVFRPGVPHTMDLPSRYILFVGSLQPRKNLPGLLSAWQLVQEQLPDVWLVVAGERYRAFRKIKLPVPERVNFLGYVSDDKLPGLYAQAQVLCLPSFDEGFGLPILEAMASGVPVVASNAGAIPEVMGEAGLQFEPSDVVSMAKVLQCSLQDRQLRQSLQARGLERVQQFTWQRSAEKIWSIFEKCQRIQT